ncbi:MAG: Dam family site-specific DNA-(adenine-N6)-methyltransferase [Acidobacteria bacterium]|nr:Dam family site-specific DNA-(adenine-N6)-methyltransferase [Acidobacteriota bacterium]
MDSHLKLRQSIQPGGCKPILRWAGSKRQVISKIAQYWRSSCARYIEPFAGSCSLFFHLAPQQSLLADINEELIEMYEVLREDPDRLYETVASVRPSKSTFYRIRNLRPAALSRLGRAARFVYLNRYCFNGIYRTDGQGRFNVPYSPRRTGPLPSIEHFRACARLLEHARLHSWDFGMTLRYAMPGDFIYLDPPYAVRSRRMFRQYGPRTFDSQDLGRLFSHLRKIHARGAIFVLSYADCKEIRELRPLWRTYRIAVKRNVAGFVGARRTAYEMLVTNAL